MTLYMKVTNDEYELPLAVADTGTELSEMTGMSKGTIYTAISRGYKTIKKVEVEDDNTTEYL